MAALSWTKAQLAGAAVDGPEDLAGHLQRTLDDEDRRQDQRIRAMSPPPARRRLMVYGIAAAAAAIAIGWIASRSVAPAAPAQAAADFRAVTSASLSLEVRTADPATLEARFRRDGLPFPVRVFDFGMMQYSLIGGGIYRFQGRQSALFAYRSDDGGGVVCQMYEGKVTELPAPGERRRQNDIDFLVYREGNLTIVFWAEGDVLVADSDSESAIRLAFAKAVKI